MSQFPGVTLGEKITFAQGQCPVAEAAQCTLVFDESLANFPVGTIPAKCGTCIWLDYSSLAEPQSAFIKDLGILRRWQSVGAGLQIPSALLIDWDAFSGGTVSGTKTQFQGLRIEGYGRTLGEKKNIETNLYNTAKGDNIAVYGATYDFGGYISSGDEGSMGLRGSSYQGDFTSTGDFPSGTVAAISGNVLTGSWTTTTNQFLGEQLPIINTSRSVYSVGTISSVSGTPCVAVGSGTSWTTLGTGAHTDLFLEVTGNSNGTVKHVVPITNVTDDTHVTLEYNQSELNATCFGSTMIASGAYNIFHGGVISSLVDPVTTTHPSAVNLASGGSNFQVGDSIQQPFGYNYHPYAVRGIIRGLVGEPNGGGAWMVNQGNQQRNGLRVTGPFIYGVAFDTGTISKYGVYFTQPVTGSLIRQDDISASTQRILSVLNGASVERFSEYDRGNDWWHWSGGQYLSASDSRFGIGTTPQPSTLGYLFYNNAAWSGLIVAPNAAANAGVPYFSVNLSGVPEFRLEELKTIINNNSELDIYSDNEITRTARITGAGAATFASIPAPGPIGGTTPSTVKLTSITGTNLLYSTTAPTISSGFGTSPSVTFNNGTASFRINVGTGGTAISGVIGLPAATNGWNCFARDLSTTNSAVFMTYQTASTTTTATIGNFNSTGATAAWSASDILSVSCFAF